MGKINSGIKAVNVFGIIASFEIFVFLSSVSIVKKASKNFQIPNHLFKKFRLNPNTVVIIEIKNHEYLQFPVNDYYIVFP